MREKSRKIISLEEYKDAVLDKPIGEWNGVDWKWFFDNICRRQDDPWGFLAEFVRVLMEE